MKKIANVERVEYLYAFATELQKFGNDFCAVSSRIRSGADADEALARTWIAQIRSRMDEAENVMMDAAGQMEKAEERIDDIQCQIDNYVPSYDEDGYDLTSHVLEHLYSQLSEAHHHYSHAQQEYQEARVHYQDMCYRHEQSQQRFAQVRQLTAQAIQVANLAATQINRLSNEAASRVQRGASIIENQYSIG